MDGNARRSLMLNRFHFGTIRPEWIRKTHSLCVVCVCNMLNGMLYCCWANMSERVLSCMLGVAEQRIRERMPFADNVLCAVHTSYISICELWLWLASVRSSVLLHSSLFMYISLYGCVFLYIVLFIFSVFSFCSIFFFLYSFSIWYKTDCADWMMDKGHGFREAVGRRRDVMNNVE